ncbi:hypothetical protein [Trinickia acidisoli]|uniref:hypothetical protein n=1 Tax=Trinickia acidisoli TaxID=2767482 RepID=UPI001A8C5BFF|nr:hypothetical protein [Trinickia acidisoli]
MKKFADNRDMTLLCPFCHCRVLPHRGPAPLNLCRTALLATRSPSLPVPLTERLSFHLIPLTADNVVFWKTYVCAMRMIVLNVNFSREMKDGWVQAVKGFLDALTAFDRTPESQVWVAAATYGPIAQHTFARSAVNIEMCMTVTTHRDVPFTTHMGIFRSPLRHLTIASLEPLQRQNMFRVNEIVALLLRDLSFLRSTSNLSGQLHAFAAKRCLQDCHRGVEKRYMITAPLKKMLEIMIRKYGADATRDIRYACVGQDARVTVGDSVFNFRERALRTYVWLFSLADLDGDRPKIAIDIRALAASTDEHRRVEAVLDWLDKWS